MVKLDTQKIIRAWETFTDSQKRKRTPKNWDALYKKNVLDKRKDAEKFFPLTEQQKVNVEYIKKLPQDKQKNHYLFCMYIPSFTNIANKKTRPSEQQVAFRHFILSVYPTSRTYHPKGIIKCYLVKKKENGIPPEYPTIFINTVNYHFFVSIIYSAINNLTL